MKSDTINVKADTTCSLIYDVIDPCLIDKIRLARNFSITPEQPCCAPYCHSFVLLA